MSRTKRELVEAAFAEIGLPVTTFNVGPDQLQRALGRLDDMMGTWDGKGIRLGYAMSSSADGSNLDDESGIPDTAFEAVITNLAIRIAPGRGKQVSPDTRATARAAYEGLLARAVYPPQQQFPITLPVGAGNKPWRYNTPFMPTPTDPLVAEQGSDQIDFE
jgi:hypothetical protein